jgi:riboflavin kinase/FMN adenylyltransferase
MDSFFEYSIFGNKEPIQQKQSIALTIGNFDGVHAGHCFLIEELKKISQNKPLVVLTFDPHPASFFATGRAPFLLTQLSDKISLLLKLGVQTVVVQKFTQQFALLEASEFCLWLQKNFNIFAMMLGHDFCYGKDRQGQFQHIKDFGYKKGWKIEQAEELKFEATQRVSSSLIRQALMQGNVQKAENLLRRPYFLSGVVVKGDQRGRLIGFPTANLRLEEDLVIPRHGVYACEVEIFAYPKMLPAVMNCGFRPTLTAGLKFQIEAHILNFFEDIYEKEVKFYLKKFLREEKKFDKMEMLQEQIKKDIEVAKIFFQGVSSF